MIVRFKKPAYRKMFDLALPFLQTRRNELHTKISYRYALRLLKGEGGDPDVAIPGILLHDVGWIMVPEDQLKKAFGPKMSDVSLRDLHEREGARMAREILDRIGYPGELAGKIALYVSRHDSGHGAESVEEAIIKDSDKLYRFSPEAVSHDPAYFRMSVAAYLDHLGERIDPWFLTRKGRRIARAEMVLRREEFARGVYGG